MAIQCQHLYHEIGFGLLHTTSISQLTVHHALELATDQKEQSRWEDFPLLLDIYNYCILFTYIYQAPLMPFNVH